LTASGTAALGQYNVTVAGTSGTLTATTTLNVTIYAPTFSLSANNVSLGQGSSTTSYVYVNAQCGLVSGVNLSVSGLPASVTASFSANPATSFSVLTLTASSTAAPGAYSVTLTGTSGSVTATTTFTVVVNTQSFTLSAGSVNIGQGGSATSYVSVNGQYGLVSGVNLSVSGLPAGVTASFTPNPTTGTSSVVLTASSTAALGQYNVTITGTSGALTATTNVVVGVYAPSFTLSNYSGVSINQGASGTSYVNLNYQYGFNGSISLAAYGLPSGATVSFATNPITSSASQSLLTVTASSAASPGQYNVTIAGTSGTTTATTMLNVIIYPQSFTLSDAPGAVTLIQGGSDKSTIYVNPVYGFSGSVSLASTGLPSGVSASWSSNSTTGSSVLTLRANSTVTPGKYAVTITGTSGAVTATAPLIVTVKGTPVTTSATLALTSAGTAVTSVSAGSMVTLTAAVSAGSMTLTTGQVNFCDATAEYCEDTHLLGTAQLTSAGTAVLRFVPGMGSHSYRAVFAGTTANGTSSSNTVALTVTAADTSITTITQSGVPGNYTLTATVTAQGLLSPTGNVSFQDTSKTNSVIGTGTLGPGVTAMTWVNSQSPTTGNSPYPVATGDFNGDGIPDLAIGNTSSNSVTILLGKGDGTFAASAVSPPTGNYPWSIVVADFNGDGNADLAVANVNSNTVSILLGNGDGTFAGGTTPATGSYPKSIAVGDFNGDGITDLAVANLLGNSATILLGNGDGTFSTSPVSPQTGSQPFSIAVADFNGDGIKDLAATNAASNTMTILLGNGDGTFTLAASPTTGSDPGTFAVGDFNGDGKVDLVVSNHYNNYLTVLLGNGDGTFIAAANAPAGSSPWGVAAANFNRNGNPGVAVANSGNNTVTVLASQLTQTATATAGGISPLGSGVHLVDASYSGDSNYNSSVSSTTGLTTRSAAPTVLVTPSLSSITTAQALTVTVAVSGGSGNPAPTGSVTLTSGDYSSAAMVLTSGSATIIIPAGLLAPGTDTLTASYVPDAMSAYNSASGSSSVSVIAATTAPAVLLSVPNHTYGDALFMVAATSNSTGAFTYSVLSGPATIAGSLVTLTGAGTVVLQATQAAIAGYAAGTQNASFAVASESQSITFAAPASPITYGASSVALSGLANSGLPVKFSVLSGPASVSGSTLTITGAGTVVVAADQAGNSSFAAAPEVTHSILVNKAGPAVGLMASLNPVLVQTAITLTATIASSAGTPTGSVLFSDGGTILGTANASGGIATVTTSTLAAGLHTITAVYSGDGNFSSTTSAILSETVQDFTLAVGGSGSSQTINLAERLPMRFLSVLAAERPCQRR
jgi:uncharacterized membrane protein